MKKLAALLLATSSCGSEPTDEQIDLISDVSGKTAEVAIQESEKIKDLESRLDELEAKVESQQNPE